MTAHSPDLDRLEQVARAADQHAWKLWGCTVLADWGGDSDYDKASLIADTFDARYPKPRTFNAEHMAAFDPPTVLALITELRQARADLEWMRRTLDLRTKALARVIAQTEPSTTSCDHDWAETTTYGDQANRYVCGHCSATRTEPRTSDQEDTRP